MSLLHQKYAFAGQKDVFASKLTFTHGDLHSENIFYDDESDTITLIDNETFALSLKIPLSGVNDIVEFYTLHTIHTLAHRVAKQLTTNEEFGIEDQTWHELCRSLITGYLDAYGELTKEDFEKLYQSFRKEFFDGFSQRKIFKSVKRITDQRALKRITVGKARRKKHLRHYELIQVFDRIHQNYLKKYDHASLL